MSVNKQRLGAVGDRPARPSLIEQVLNQKRLVRLWDLYELEQLLKFVKVVCKDKNVFFFFR